MIFKRIELGIVVFILFAAQIPLRAGSIVTDLPKRIYVENNEKSSHVQGVAVDTKRGYAYFSFTTKLIKTDLYGHLIGSVTGLTCHLGCIDLDTETGKLYASIEYKDDEIGRGILQQMGRQLGKRENTFYIGIFNTDKITSPNISAESGDVMKTVFLPEVVKMYEDSVFCNGHLTAHHYGCSGIDGIALGPQFGKTNGKSFLNVDVAIYGDTTRHDNDYQLLLQFDPRKIEKWALPLDQNRPHHSGPPHAAQRYFIYTGNTSYGIQNLKYDPSSHFWFAAVYPGHKTQFHNFQLFAIDGTKKPVKQILRSDKPEKAHVLSLAETGCQGYQQDIYGWDFNLGSTGIAAIGNGLFYISHNGSTKQGHQFCDLRLYKWTGNAEKPFEEVK